MTTILNVSPRKQAMATTRYAAFLTAALPIVFASNATAALHGRDLGGDAGFEAYYDDILNVTWLADVTSGGGRRTQAQASAYVASLNVYGITGWRLPTVKPMNGVGFVFDKNTDFTYNGSFEQGFNIANLGSELPHLFYVTLGNKGYFDTSGNLQPGYGMSNAGPFLNLSQNIGDPAPFTVLQNFWSSTEYSPGFGFALVAFTGGQTVYSAALEFNTWAVRDGDVSAVPEPNSYALMFAGVVGLSLFMRRKPKSPQTDA